MGKGVCSDWLPDYSLSCRMTRSVANMDIVLVGRALGQIGLVLVREVGPCGACGDLGRASLGRKDEKVEKVKQNVKVVICCPK